VPVTITFYRNERKPDWFWGGNISAIGLVTGGLTLIAFIIATVAGILRARLKQEADLISTLPEGERGHFLFNKH
jgi:hypothetical protein